VLSYTGQLVVEEEDEDDAMAVQIERLKKA
jgi:hypothetical protein